MNSQTKTCQNCKSNFTIEPDDFTFYEKMQVPPPTWCHMCRAQRRYMFRNERALFKRKCDLSGKEFYSTYPQSVPFPVYMQEEWFSDKWDPMEYGVEYDFSRPFFEQFIELSRKVPKLGKSALLLTNSDYSNNANDLKNCYLIFNSAYSENCMYGNAVNYSNNCIDNSQVHQIELSYENFNSARSSRIFFSDNIVGSSDVYFSKDLRGCNDCFGCVNLRKKSYHIFNKPYPKNAYVKKLEEYNLGSYESIQKFVKEAKSFWLKFPNKFIKDGAKSVNVSGEYIYQSKNVKDSYMVVGGEDLRYCQYTTFPAAKDCYDHTGYAENTVRSYEFAVGGLNANNTKFCLQSWSDIRDLEYCEYCQSSSDLFGCVSLRKKQYCILNKQYDEESFVKLRKKIIEHMNEMPYTDKGDREYRYGEFFPIEVSPFGYKETIADEHFPLTKDKILKKKYNWRDVEPNKYPITVPTEKIPDHIKNVDEKILKETLGCAHEGKCDQGCVEAFKIMPQELQFYKRFNLPLPRLCVNCRHRERLKKRNPMRLFPRKCMCAGTQSEQEIYKNTTTHQHHGESRCPNEFETTYSPDREEIVYCEQCYNAEVA